MPSRASVCQSWQEPPLSLIHILDTTAETGQTVTIGLGDSYQAIYGQLKELEVSAGDYVSQGDTIGYLAEPTKYYSVEGANLYFAMTKEGKPVNPMDYIR